MILRIDYQEPDVMLDLWGGTTGTFDGLDRFNRIIDQRWKTSGGTDKDRFKYGYDRDSNRQWKENTVSKALGSPVYMDEYYTYDNLNRLTVMKRGQLSSGTISSPTKDQDWTLDKTGNWTGFLTKTSGTTDLNQTRTHSPVNQINGISQSTGSAWVNPTYDEAGNTLAMPQVGDPTLNYTATYDAWNRMTGITAVSGGVAVGVASYTYDGRGRRITQSYGLTLGPDLYYSNDWQVLEEATIVGTAAQYVWGIRYVDELICRDASSTRLYALQDANFNLTSIVNTSGAVQERYAFYPYGQRLIFDASWATRSSSSYSWLIGHQGLRHDATTGIIDNRMRQLHPMLGRFLQYDPMRYFDGANLYQYCSLNPIVFHDPSGLILLDLAKIAWPCFEKFGVQSLLRGLDKGRACNLFAQAQSGTDFCQGAIVCDRALSIPNEVRSCFKDTVKEALSAATGNVVGAADPVIGKLVDIGLNFADDQLNSILESNFFAEMRAFGKCHGGEVVVVVQFSIGPAGGSPKWSTPFGSPKARPRVGRPGSLLDDPAQPAEGFTCNQLKGNCSACCNQP
jgi:RHS repeat-associated protein